MVQMGHKLNFDKYCIIRKTIPMEKECKKSKMAVWGGLTNSCGKKRGKKERRKGKIYASECRVPKNSKKRSVR